MDQGGCGCVLLLDVLAFVCDRTAEIDRQRERESGEEKIAELRRERSKEVSEDKGREHIWREKREKREKRNGGRDEIIKKGSGYD